MRPFSHAARGLITLVQTQRNAKIHVAAAAIVILLGIVVNVSRTEWCMLVLSMGAVMTAEAMNTGIEFVCDALHPDHHPLIGKAKDVAAGGVLIAAVSAATVGLFVFL